MPFEEASAKKTEADDYFRPIEELRQEESTKTSDILSRTAWQPPTLEASPPGDKAKAGDRLSGAIEISSVYPISEVDKRAQAWIDYAGLHSNSADLKLSIIPKTGQDTKPSDPKPTEPKPGENPYPYEDPYQPPADYTPPPAPEAQGGTDTAQIVAGLAGLAAAAYALRKGFQWLNRDKVKPIVDKAAAERKAEYTEGRVVARAKDGAELDWKKFDGKEFEDASGKKIPIKDAQFKLELPEGADKNAEKALRSELELKLRGKAELSEQARKLAVEVDPAMTGKEEKLIYREKTSGKEFEITGSREGRLEIKDGDAVRLVTPAAEDSIVYKTSAENEANVKENGQHYEKLVRTLTNDNAPAAEELIKATENLAKREGELKTEEERLKQEKERIAAESKQIEEKEKTQSQTETKLKEESAKLSSEESKLQGESEKLSERETKLAEEKTQLQERQAKLEQAQKEVQEQKKQADADKSKIALEEARQQTEKTELADKAAKINEEASKLNQDKQALNQLREELLSMQEKQLAEERAHNAEKLKLQEEKKAVNESRQTVANQESSFLEKKAEFLRDSIKTSSELKIAHEGVNFNSENEQLNKLQEQLEKVQKDLDSRKAELDKSEEKIRGDKTQVETDRKALAEEKTRVEAEKTNPAADQNAIEEKLKQITEQEKAIAERETALNAEEQKIADERKLMAEKQLEIEKQKLQISDDKALLQEGDKLLEARRQNLEAQAAALAAEQDKVTKRSSALETEKTAIAAEKTAIADSQSKLVEERSTLEKKGQEQGATKAALTEERARLAGESDTLSKEKTDLESKKTAEQERIAKELADKEQAAKEQAEKERAAKEQAEKERAAKELADKEQAAKEQAEKERAAKELADKEQAAKEQAEKERAAKEQAAKEQAAKEQAEKTSVDAIKSELAGNETFARLTDETRMGEALNQLTDRSLQRMPQGSPEEKAEFLSKQLKAAMRKQLGVATDAGLPESIRNLQVKIVDSDAAAPRLSTETAGQAAVLEIPAKLLAENPKGVLVDAYSQTSGLGMMNLLHEKGNIGITMRSLEPMLNNIAEKAEKIVGARSLALQSQEKASLPADAVASDRQINFDPKKPPVTAWDGENLSFSGEKFHVGSEIEKLQKERETNIKELEEKARKARELAETSKKAEDISAHQELEKRLAAEKQNLRVVQELKLAMNGERGLIAQEKARSLVKEAADRAIADRLSKPGGGGAPMSRAAAAAMIITSLAFLYVATNKPAQADEYDSKFR